MYVVSSHRAVLTIAWHEVVLFAVADLTADADEAPSLADLDDLNRQDQLLVDVTQ